MKHIFIGHFHIRKPVREGACRRRHRLRTRPSAPSPLPSMLLLVPLLLFLPLPPSAAQAISTTMPVPPLQWLNITNLIQGTSAPPLKYPSIGYDDSSRTLLLFGGQSSSGIPISQTFLSVLLPCSFCPAPQRLPTVSTSIPTLGPLQTPRRICP